MNYEELLYNEINNEDSGLWFFSNHKIKKFILKLPSNSIKSIYSGCKVELFFKNSKIDNLSYLLAGMNIHDSKTNPLVVFGINRFEKKNEAIKEILNEDNVIIDIYNELNIPAVSGNIKIDEVYKNEILKLLDESNNHYTGSYDKNIDMILDVFQESLSKNFLDVDILIECKISDIVIVTNLILGANKKNEIILNDNEGVGFESQVCAVLDSLFKNNLYKNPFVEEKKKKRELIDILAFYDLGIFLIEVKAMGVFSVNENISMERKVANLISQIKKAIKQVVGARKMLEKNSKIIDSKDNEILFDKSIFPHCLIIVSELLHFGDWKKIEMLILKTMIEENLCLNVMDFVELMKYVKFSNGKKEMFDYFLLERRNKFIENGANIHLRAKIG